MNRHYLIIIITQVNEYALSHHHHQANKNALFHHHQVNEYTLSHHHHLVNEYALSHQHHHQVNGICAISSSSPGE